MAGIHQITLADRVESLPELVELGKEGIPNASLFICVLGFEERCLSAPQLLAESRFRSKDVLVLSYPTNREENEANLEELRAHLERVSDNLEWHEIEEATICERVRGLVAPLGPDETVVFDISVAASRVILCVLSVLLDAACSIRIVYSEADRYHPTREHYEASAHEWNESDEVGLEHGVLDVFTSPAQPGNHLDAVPNCVVLFPSFKPDRSRAVLSNVDPMLGVEPRDSVVWIVGRPHLAADEWRQNAMSEINGLGEDTPQYLVSTFDYKETLLVLEDVHSKRCLDYQITVSPLGSKLQSVGVTLFCTMHSDVRAVLAVPKEYNAPAYSEGTKAVWQLDFGPAQKVQEVLNEVGCLVIAEN